MAQVNLTPEQIQGLKAILAETQKRSELNIPENVKTGEYMASKNAPSWSLSGWGTDGAGNWTTQPQLVINGQTFIFDNPQDYIKKLQEIKAMPNATNTGILDNFINQFNSTTTEFVNKKGTTNKTGTSTGTSGIGGVENIKIPSDVEESEYYKSLDEDGKKLVKYYYGILNANDEATKAKFKEALDLAKEQADPYWKEKINIVNDALTRSLATTEADLVSTEKTLNDRINQINEDLTYNKEQLTIEEQADLKKQADDLQTELDTTRETMASKGLSSSSIKTQAEEASKEAYSDLTESTTRKYAREKRTEEVTAARNLALYNQQLLDARRKALEEKTKSARTVEEKLGTADTSTLLGGSNLLLGGISGSIGEEKGTDILSRANALLLTK